VPKKTLSIKEKYTVMQYIETHCSRPPDDQYATWDSVAKTDQHVADLFKPTIPNINAGHVRGMRQELNLLLEPSRFFNKQRDQSIEDLRVSVKQLEARVEALEDKYTTPPKIPGYVDRSYPLATNTLVRGLLADTSDVAIVAGTDFKRRKHDNNKR
jgi:hypothetical protein